MNLIRKCGLPGTLITCENRVNVNLQRLCSDLSCCLEVLLMPCSRV